MKNILTAIVLYFITGIIYTAQCQSQNETSLISTSKFFKAICVYKIDSIYGSNFVGVAYMYNSSMSMTLDIPIAEGYHTIELGIPDKTLYTMEYTFEKGKKYFLVQNDGVIELYVDKIKEGNKVNATIIPLYEYKEPEGQYASLQYKTGLVASALKEQQFLIAVQKVDGTYKRSKASYGFDPRCHVFNNKDYTLDLKLSPGKHKIQLTAQGKNKGEIQYLSRPLEIEMTAEAGKTYTFNCSFLSIKNNFGDYIKVEVVENK
jgi:hypothetical protein